MYVYRFEEDAATGDYVEKSSEAIPTTYWKVSSFDTLSDDITGAIVVGASDRIRPDLVEATITPDAMNAYTLNPYEKSNTNKMIHTASFGSSGWSIAACALLSPVSNSFVTKIKCYQGVQRELGDGILKPTAVSSHSNTYFDIKPNPFGAGFVAVDGSRVDYFAQNGTTLEYDTKNSFYRSENMGILNTVEFIKFTGVPRYYLKK